MEFSRPEYCSRLPFPAPGDHPDPGIKPTFPASPALAGGFFTTTTPGKPHFNYRIDLNSLGKELTESKLLLRLICRY